MLSLSCQDTLLKACNAGIVEARPAPLHAHQAPMGRLALCTAVSTDDTLTSPAL